MWWSGNHRIPDVIPTLQWFPKDWLSDGILRFRVVSCPLCLVYTSIGRVALVSGDTELDGVVKWLKGRSSENLHAIEVYLKAIYFYRSNLSWDHIKWRYLIRLIFWPLEPSRNLSPLAFTGLLRSFAEYREWEPLNTPGQTIQVRHLCRCSVVCDPTWPNTPNPEETTRVLRIYLNSVLCLLI